MPTTTIQKDEAIRKGSVRVSIGTDFSSLVDIGALRNPVFTALVENQSIEFDNVDDLKKFVKGKRVQISFDLAEINLTHLAQLEDGLVTLTTVAASSVSVTGEALGTGWTVGQPIQLDNKNGDNTIVTSIVIDAAGTPLVSGTDYNTYVGDGENGELGYTYIVPVTASSAVLDADYDYTPNASKKITLASSGTKGLDTVVRIKNTDEDDKDFYIDMENVTNLQAMSIDFAGDAEEDVAVLPFQLEGDLVEIVDEQQVT